MSNQPPSGNSPRPDPLRPVAPSDGPPAGPAAGPPEAPRAGGRPRDEAAPRSGGGEELGFDLPPPAKPSRARVVAAALGVAALLGAAFLASWLPRHRAQGELVAESKAASTAAPRVRVIRPKLKASDRALSLPGAVQALEETTIYSRASGYVRAWKADIGDAVAEGALLAEIDVPEVDQQLAQARAQLAQAEAGLEQARANRGYSRTTLERFRELTPKGVASQQDLDKSQAQSLVDEANVGVAEANVVAQKANVARYVQMQGFSRITAPFAGTVNARLIERGALVSPSTPLFKISQSETVRVFTQVPQDMASSVAAGQPARVTLREFPGRAFEGTVARSAGALDPQSRTMTTEVRVPNPKRELLAGMYAQVALTLPSSHRAWELPATAVIADAKGVRVAVVDNQSRLRLVPVTIERDNGASMDLSSGITEDDRVVALGSAELADGREVEVAP
ncbi:MAG TPA: efflux RND transporter periplasmic adaptor subunit [Polyangiaceae bacterium]|nr:efflux RND transporter periplasmic adaptor subunit [Polyangiaceae bacterium]